MRLCTKISIAYHCLLFISEYEDSEKITSDMLAKSTGSNAVIVRNILSSLKKADIISVKFGTGGATLKKALSDITLYDVCIAVEPHFLDNVIVLHSNPSDACPIGHNIHKVLDVSYDKVKQDLAQSLQNITMEDMKEDYYAILKAE